jgi:NADH dehydrogenase
MLVSQFSAVGFVMSILVVGATGFVGGEIARKLAVQNHKVAGLVRGGNAHPKAKQLLSAGIEIIAGDLCKPETLVHALKNAETVVCTATSMPSATDNGLQKIDHDGILALIEVAEQQGVKKFVYVSYSGNICEESPLETAKRECENRLLASQMEAVILRPSYFMEVWLSPALGFDPANGSARVYGTGDARVSYISAKNVADFGAVAALREYAEKNAILEMGGSEPLSQHDVVRIFEEALHRRIRVDHAAAESLQTQHESCDPLQKTLGALMLAYSKGDVVKQAAETARQHGVVLRSVAEYASGFRTAATG